MPYVLTPEKEALLRREWPLARLKMPDLAEALGCSDHTVRRMARLLDLGGRPSQLSEWPEERLERLLKLYKRGLSAAQIARELGGGVSRNAVIGIIHRRIPQVERRQPPAKPARAPKAPTARRIPSIAAIPKAAKPKLAIAGNGTVYEQAPVAKELPPVKARAWEPLPGVTPIARDAARSLHCKWPITVDQDELGFCCGAVAAGGPYCGAHERLAQPADAAQKQRAIDRSHARAIFGRRAA